LKTARPIVAVTGLALAGAWAGDARASAPWAGDALRDLAERVVVEWRKAGADVDRGPPRYFFDEGETITISLAPGAEDKPCTTVAILGARGLSFHAKIAGMDEDPLTDEPGARVASVAGVLAMESCEPSARPLDHLLVTLDAGRGAIEIVVARSPKPLPALKTVLPERTGGVLPASPDAGPPPILPPPAARAANAEQRAKHDGATVSARATWTAAGDGSGDARIALEAGCHRVELFAPEPPRAAPGESRGRRRRLDVDAEIRDEDEDLLARDRSDSPDAHLETCVGSSMKATVIFAGAPPNADVIATHVFWPMPEHLPTLWIPEARARMARVIRARHASGPPAEAIGLWGGPSSGMAPIAIPVQVEPRACYLAVAAAAKGEVRGLGLRAVVGGADARDERTGDDDAGVVAFCTRDETHARLEVEARGITLGFAWGLALFRLGSGMAGEP
jgi:hypothetical protein